MHVFSIPSSLFDTLSLRDNVSKPYSRQHSPSPLPAVITGPRACNICLASTFGDVHEQRTHFRSDWHRYNVKIRINGANPITEHAFLELIDELDDSISGSASSSSEDSDHSETHDPVSALVNKAKISPRAPSPTSLTRRTPRTPLAWFHSPPSTQIGVYKALFLNDADPSSYLLQLQEMQNAAERTWAVFMTAGGHFAGAIVRVSHAEDEETNKDEGTKKKKQKRPKPDIEVLKHKTFHRYTTRRKQGGSQSLNDNAKGNAKSAGAQLRRYGEQALRDDIHNLLHEWADEITDCERIWIRASTSNKRMFLDHDHGIIMKGDERLRTFPFPTRRPTLSELDRCLLELTKVKLSHFTEDALRAQDEAYLASLPKPKPVPTKVASASDSAKPKPAKLSKEEEIFREKWTRLLEMVYKSRLDALIAFWDRDGSNMGGIDIQIPEWTGEKRATLLQVASAVGNEDVIKWLLEEARADPTIHVPFRGSGTDDKEDDGDSVQITPDSLPPGSHRTAYDLAQTRGARNVFRRCAAANPDWWDWLGAARVASVLSQEMEEEQEEKKKLRRKNLKDKVREREAREKERAPPPPPEPVVEVVQPQQLKSEEVSGPRKLGGAGGRVESVAGLTPEMRARIERERRARAAEARMKANS